LLPHVDFDLEQAITKARQVNPDITAFLLSARTGEELPAWYTWLRREVAIARDTAFE